MKAARERVKRSKTRQKTVAKKRRRVVHESSTESEHEKEKTDDNEDHDVEPDDVEAQRVKEYTIVKATSSEGVSIDPLAIKHTVISFDFGHKELPKGKKILWGIKRTNGVWTYCHSFEQMLCTFDRDDVCTLWKLMKEKFGTKGPKEAIDKVAYYYSKDMFEPDIADEEWKILKNGKLKKWDLFQNYGVHSLIIDGKSLFMLVEKDYPALNFQTDMIHQMLQPKMMHLQFKFDEMA